MKHVLEIQKDLKNTGLFLCFFITDTYLFATKGRDFFTDKYYLKLEICFTHLSLLLFYHARNKKST